MRPEDFGARSGDPTFDSGPGLNAFFASCAANNVLDADVSGDWYTDSQIVVGPALGTSATQAYFCGACTITAKSGFLEAVVSIQNSAYVHFIGYLFVLPTNLALQPVPSIVMAGIHNTKDVTLKATPGASEKFGINSMVIHALGTGASHQPTGTWTFTPETGFTVNGSASAAFSGFTKPAMFVCVLDQSAKNWIVYIAN